MKRVFLLALLLGWLTSTAAWADISLPKNLQYIDPKVRFEGVEKFDDHVFYLRYLTFTGGPANTPYTLTQVKDSKPFNLNCQRRLINMSLLALERTEFDKRAKDDPTLKWLTGKAEGVKAVSLNSPSTTGKVGEAVPVTTYTVTIKDGKLTVELQKADPPKDGKTSSASPDGLLPPWTLGVVFALSLAGLGLWFAKRR